jgi:hypothetical protein
LGNPTGSTINAGKYKILPAGSVLTAPSNYILNYQNGNLLVGKSLLKAIALDTSRQYGSPNPVFAVGYTGFLNGDTVSSITVPTATSTATQNSLVGSYPIVLSGGGAVNYILQDGNGTMTITKANLIATADYQTRAYGDPNPSLTISYNGFLNGDGVSSISVKPVIATLANALSPVGTYPITVSGGSALNYNLQDVPDILNISPASLVVDADDKGINDDDNLPVFTSTITGFRNGENNTIISGPQYSVSPVYQKDHPGIYTITPSALVLSYQNNYNISYLPGTLYVNNDNGNNIVPKLDCVELLSNDPSGFNYAAHFSYNNPNSTLFYVPVGTNNKITTTGSYSGQLPIVFQPGSGQFKIYFDGTKMTWTLTTYNGNHSTAVAATASSTSSRCSSGSGTLQAVVEDSITNETAETPIEPTASIYPNPSKGLVTINIKNGTLSSANIQIIDAFGRVIPVTGKKLSDQSIQVDLALVRSGVYFIRILVGNEYKIFRVVKM